MSDVLGKSNGQVAVGEPESEAAEHGPVAVDDSRPGDRPADARRGRLLLACEPGEVGAGRGARQAQLPPRAEAVEPAPVAGRERRQAQVDDEGDEPLSVPGRDVDHAVADPARRDLSEARQLDRPKRGGRGCGGDEDERRHEEKESESAAQGPRA